MTTTETPSVDCGHLADGGECIECMAPPSEEEQWRENVLRSVARYSLSATPARGRAVEDALERHAAAVRAEAIRERDEAIGLLRRAEWGGMDMSAGAGSDKHCPSCLNSKETGHWEGCAVAAFLARFPEGGEG